MTWPRVLAVPGGHPHLDRLHGPVARLVGRDDPVGGGPVRPLDPDWIAQHAMAWDVAHLQLGLDAGDPLGRWSEPADDPAAEAAGDVVAAARAHRAAGVPVVVTVHGLGSDADPADPAGSPVLSQLAAVDDDVAAVLTLTRGCATVLQQQLRRPVRAIPHGPLLDAATRIRLRAHRRRLPVEEQPILVHPGVDRDDVLWRDVLEAVRRSGSAHPVRVLVREEAAPEVAEAAAGLASVTVDARRWLDLEDLGRLVAQAGALLLADRGRAHSALVELAADVGTPVMAAAVGWRAHQQPVVPLPVAADGAGRPRLDVDALAEVLEGPLPTGPVAREWERERDDHAFRSHHQRLYHRLLLGRPEEAEAVLLLPDGAADVLPEPR